MTNADKVRQMTDKELWCWVCDLGIVCMCDYNPARCKNYVKCRECWKDWLAEEADCSDMADGSKKQGDER